MAEAHRYQAAIRKVGGTLFTDLETCPQCIVRGERYWKTATAKSSDLKIHILCTYKTSRRDDSKGVCHCYPLPAVIRLAVFMFPFIFSFFNIKYGLIGKINQMQSIKIINLRHKR